MKAEQYLVIPERYFGDAILRWSPSGDAVENSDGTTFALGVEVIHFLEGFASQRPLVHFGFILHLLALLRPSRLPRPVPPSLLSEAFSQWGRNVRNAGAFCALLCREVPPVVHPPTVEQLWDLLMMAGWGNRVEEHEAAIGGEGPPWTMDEFDAQVRNALRGCILPEVLHWIRQGCGSATRAAEKVAEEVLETRPRSLAGVLAALAQHVRLRESVPFVGQLVSALTLPPRHLLQPELPLGGFSDVTTRGPVEHLLPSQLVFEGLEFVRRHAHNELLYFRREEPQQPTAESLVILLDQGVRTWGIVRVVLTAALFALGQLAGRRRLPLRLAATSNGGQPCDPLEASEADLEKLLAASDLSPHPGLALETVLEEEPEAARDVVLLTHPRSLTETDVQAAARRASPHTRLFAVTLNDRGEVGLHQMRHGSPVSLSRFHVDLTPAIPAAPMENTAPRRAWQGDVEPIGYPFQLGLDFRGSPLLAFDHSGEWLVVAANGLLFLVHSDGSHYEILPAPRQAPGAIVDVVRLAEGVGVVWRLQHYEELTEYDLRTRTVRHGRFDYDTIRPLRLEDCAHPPEEVLSNRYRSLPVQGRVGGVSICPGIELDSATGSIRLHRVRPTWKTFTLLEDNQPVLRNCKLLGADCQGHTLAALFEEDRRGTKKRTLRLFHGPEGIPQAALALHGMDSSSFALSSDGRQLAWQYSPGSLQIRETTAGGRTRCLRSLPRYHAEVRIQLHDSGLWIGNSSTVHLVGWHTGSLVWSRGLAAYRQVADVRWAGAFSEGIPDLRPPFLGPGAADRFRVTAAGRHLLAVADRFGQVALVTHAGQLLCMFVTWQDKLAAWMPDGTCFGAGRLLGCPQSPGAARKIGQALLAVSPGMGSAR